MKIAGVLRIKTTAKGRPITKVGVNRINQTVRKNHSRREKREQACFCW